MKILFTTLLSLSLALAPVSGFSQLPAAAKFNTQPVQTGHLDGVVLAWQCSDHAQGYIKFLFKTPDGVERYGLISCGEQV
jgi:hypothetical protein